MRWLLIDIETTGLNVLHDKITEIALSVLTENGIEYSWNTLINPESSIPESISQLTGINNEMVESAPTFTEIADELIELFSDGIFVAHNARFDYAFLRNAFKQAGYHFRLPILCTIKLFKQCYPALSQYNLRFLANHFNLTMPTHRAVDDVVTLHDLLKVAMNELSADVVYEAAKKCYRQSSIPSKLVTDIKNIPNTPGVYLFYGENNELPIYIGKSITLKQRILSHFQSDHSSTKEFKMAQQVTRIDTISTAGELSALLLESALIKEKMPLYNRRLRRKKNIVGFKLIEQSGYITIETVRSLSSEEESEKLYGSYRSFTAAKDKLRLIIKNYRLCPKLCGLENSKNACFSMQVKRCYGACIGNESTENYNNRVRYAFNQLKQATWPFAGSIAIKEQCAETQLTQYVIFNQWRHIGTVEHLEDIDSLPTANMNYDLESYKILYHQLQHKIASIEIIHL